MVDAIAEAPVVLVVDDDLAHRRLVVRWLRSAGYEPVPCPDGHACLDALAQHLPDAVLMDLHMESLDGEATLRRLRELNPDVPVLMLSGDTEVPSVVRTMRAGAYDYLTKPTDRHRVTGALSEAVADHAQRVARRGQGEDRSGIFGTSPPVERLRRTIAQVGPNEITVLIGGPSGSGKELVATALHEQSGRRSGPFIAINCAAIPTSLQESELFGHEKGAFTGAHNRRIGRFEQAEGGTLFLDEVAELDLGLQATLLRVLQERRLYRVGGRQEIGVDVRVIAATHRDLRAEVAAGRFREDLYYRLAVFEIRVPALAERTGDVGPLAQHLLDDLASKAGKPSPTLGEAALQVIRAHDWPGNVRELINAMQRALVTARGGEVGVDDLPEHLRRPRRKTAPRPVVAPNGTMEDIERDAIVAALAEEEGNVSAVIRRLGIPRTTLYRKLKKYGLR